MSENFLFRTFNRYRNNGTVSVEFALISVLLFFLIFAIIDLSLMFWLTLSMQFAVREGARYAVTGQTNLDPNTAAQVRYLAVIESIKNNSMGMYDVLSPEISVKNYGSDSILNSSLTYNPLLPASTIFGNSGDIIVLQLNNCTWSHLTVLRPFFADGKYHFNVAATMRNEVFP